MTEENKELQELQKALVDSFKQLNQTLQDINENHQDRENILKGLNENIAAQNASISKHHRLSWIMLAIAIVVALPIGINLYNMVDEMAEDMQNMSVAMGVNNNGKWSDGSMAYNMNIMADEMAAMRVDMDSMSSNMGSMSTNMDGMRQDMGSMNTHMGDMRTDIGSMSGDMGQMREDMGYMRNATVNMDVGMRHMTHDMRDMSRTVSPAMNGMRQMMPWAQ